MAKCHTELLRKSGRARVKGAWRVVAHAEEAHHLHVRGDAQRRDEKEGEEGEADGIDHGRRRAEAQRQRPEKRHDKGGGGDGDAKVVMPVLIRGALALLLRDVEVGKADERGENIEKDARAQPPFAAAEGGADDAGEHAEADHVVERVDLDTEALFLFGAVESVQQARNHQAQQGGIGAAVHGRENAADAEGQREIGRKNGIVVNSDHGRSFISEKLMESL